MNEGSAGIENQHGEPLWLRELTPSTAATYFACGAQCFGTFVSVYSVDFVWGGTFSCSFIGDCFVFSQCEHFRSYYVAVMYDQCFCVWFVLAFGKERVWVCVYFHVYLMSGMLFGIWGRSPKLCLGLLAKLFVLCDLLGQHWPPFCD